MTEPSATFSTCFGAPFLPLTPNVYAKQLGERIAKHSSRVWLVNTGWTGGPYGVGTRMKIAYTRAMIRAALSGALDQVAVPAAPGVQHRRADELSRRARRRCSIRAARGRTRRRTTQQAGKLARMFVENFKTNFADADAGRGRGRPEI